MFNISFGIEVYKRVRLNVFLLVHALWLIFNLFLGGEVDEREKVDLIRSKVL